MALNGEDKLFWQSWAGLRVPPGRRDSAGNVELEHDGDPAVEAKTTDTTLRLKLGYEW